MKRSETKLLVENWRKVLNEGLHDSDPEILEENLKRVIGNLGLVATMATAVLPKTVDAIPTDQNIAQMVNQAINTDPTDLDQNTPGAQTLHDIIEPGSKYKDISNSEDFRRFLQSAENVLTVKEIEKQIELDNPNYQLPPEESQRLINFMVSKVSDAVQDHNNENEDAFESGEIRGVFGVYGGSFREWAQKEYRNLRNKNIEFFKSRFGNPKLRVMNIINSWSNNIKRARSLDDVEKISEKLIRRLEKERKKGNTDAAKALDTFENCGSLVPEPGESEESYNARWKPFQELNQSLGEN